MAICRMLGFPFLGIEWQKMENPDLRMAMGMKPDQKGVRIRRIDPTAPDSEVLKPLVLTGWMLPMMGQVCVHFPFSQNAPEVYLRECIL